ncbi:MAG: HPr family phosphocarrier protein [Desulfovibrionaceae bacterium]|jgi:phosphocarrier protein HPr|nr:HPr family phosphocarrier protein [Desulfovibrionaceae bacterium]
MLDVIEETNEGLRMVVPVRSPLGIHARPAAALAREAQTFEAAVFLETEHGRADAKSMLDILSLAASTGTLVTVVAQGNDASSALHKIGGMIAGIEE